jgi:hypothetical protein
LERSEVVIFANVFGIVQRWPYEGLWKINKEPIKDSRKPPYTNSLKFLSLELIKIYKPWKYKNNNPIYQFTKWGSFWMIGMKDLKIRAQFNDITSTKLWLTLLSNEWFKFKWFGGTSHLIKWLKQDVHWMKSIDAR